MTQPTSCCASLLPVVFGVGGAGVGFAVGGGWGALVGGVAGLILGVVTLSVATVLALRGQGRK